jgi:hypothetical protein
MKSAAFYTREFQLKLLRENQYSTVRDERVVRVCGGSVG